MNVIAENDNAPVFEGSSYQFNISENLPARSRIGTVRATDADMDVVTYSLHPEYIRGETLDT